MDRVFILTYEFPPKTGGVATFVQEVAAAAARTGLELRVIAPEGACVPGGGRYGIEVFSRRWWRTGMLYALLRRRRVLRDATLYLPQQRALRAMMYLQLLPLIRPAALILTLHGTEIFYFDALPHRRWLFGALLRRAARVTVLSRYCAGLLGERFPDVREKTVIAPGAVRSVLAQPALPVSAAGRPLAVLSVARLHPRKGQLDVLQAIDRLSPELKERLVYRIVGAAVDQDYRRRLQTYAAERRLNVELLGEVEDARLPGIYAQADVFVMPSSEREKAAGWLNAAAAERSVEGFGLSYLEAAAFGLPVLAYRTGGVPEAVRDGETGILVGENDVPALSEALTALLTDESFRRRLGENGRRWAARFSWDETARIVFGLGAAP